MSEGTSAESSLDLQSPTPEPTSQSFQVLTTSLTRPGPLHALPSSETTKECDWIDLVKQGGATPESLLPPRLPSDHELRLFFGDLNLEPSLVSHDSAAFEDVDDLPPPCLLTTFSSLSKHANRPSDSRPRSHSRNPTKRDGRPLIEPATPQDDDVFFRRGLQSTSRISPSEGMVGSIILTLFLVLNYSFLYRV
jgi:hypothetical protein